MPGLVGVFLNVLSMPQCRASRATLTGQMLCDLKGLSPQNPNHPLSLAPWRSFEVLAVSLGSEGASSVTASPWMAAPLWSTLPLTLLHCRRCWSPWWMLPRACAPTC